MNVYDFDETIYPKNSPREFFFWLTKKYPRLKWQLPKLIFLGILYLLKIIKHQTYVQIFYHSFVPYIDPEQEARIFWDEHYQFIEKWYLDQKHANDLISSASPEFLIAPIADKLNLSYQASRVDTKTGDILGAENYHREKVRRFKEAYPKQKIAQFYSDSLSDAPMAQLAQSAYLVKKGTVKDWPF